MGRPRRVGYHRCMLDSPAKSLPRSVGDHLREWRGRRRMSQLDLAAEADISARHLSFVETGRSQPSREMVLHLAQALETPLRARNALLMAAASDRWPIRRWRRRARPSIWC